MTILLNPGPVLLSERVRHALLKPDLCHREPEFSELQNGIKNKLLDVYQLAHEEWAAVLLTGSGTAGMEAMLTSLVPRGRRILIIENGTYGERLGKIARSHNIDYITLRHDWGETIDPGRLENALRDQTTLAYVAVVHHETTTGLLNDIESLAVLCKKYGNIPILLDAISSFGAEEIKFADWNIAACTASTNKCLHGSPGAAFTLVRRTTMAQMPEAPPQTFYLDLGANLAAQDTGDSLFTPSVHVFYALDEALDELSDRGGWRGRRRQYRTLMNIVRSGLQHLGLTLWLAEEDCSCVLNAFHLPDGLTYNTLHDQLKSAGFVIYAGQGNLEKSIFRISCMGKITSADMKRFVDEMEKIVPAGHRR